MIASSILNSITFKNLTGSYPNMWNTLHADRRFGNFKIIPYYQKFQKDHTVYLQFESDIADQITLKTYCGTIEIESFTRSFDSQYGTTNKRYYTNFTVVLDSPYYDKKVYFTATQGTVTEYVVESVVPTNPTDAEMLVNSANAAYGDLGGKVYKLFAGEYIPDDIINLIETPVVWKNVAGLSTDGPLNRCGVWSSLDATPGQYIGFGKSITVATPKIYYIGIGADNYMEISVNGTVIKSFPSGDGIYDHYRSWHLLPVMLRAGINLIHIRGYNDASAASVGAEIYNATLAELQAMASVEALDAVTIFSTKDFIGEYVEEGNFGTGYTCPEGYTLTDTEGVKSCDLVTAVETVGGTLTSEPIYTLDLTDGIAKGIIKYIKISNLDRIESDLDDRFVDWSVLDNDGNFMDFFIDAIDIDPNDTDESEILEGSQSKTILSARFYSGRELKTSGIPDYMCARLGMASSLDIFVVNDIQYIKSGSIGQERFGGSTLYQLSMKLTQKLAIGINVDNIGLGDSPVVPPILLTPMYVGTVTSAAPDETEVKLITPITAVKENQAKIYTITDARPCFAYPASFGSLTSILDNINDEIISGFNIQTLTFTIGSDSISYKIYTLKNLAAITSFTITFKFT